MKKELRLTFITMDRWSRPVYRGDDGRLYVDTDPGCVYPSIHTKSSNDIEGEPDFPISEDMEITFMPYRIIQH